MEKPEFIFESTHVVIVHKPHGWLSVPSRIGDNDLRPCLGKYLEDDLGKKIFPVHRLDVEVSGLILFALSSEAHKAASRWFEQREVKKTYSAVTTHQGSLLPQSDFRWESKLLRGKKRAYESPHGKDCLTLANVTDQSEHFLLWHLTPITGRPHQLRFELSHRGYPILGDKLYASPIPRPAGEITLSCVGLDFSRCTDSQAYGLSKSYTRPPYALIPLEKDYSK